MEEAKNKFYITRKSKISGLKFNFFGKYLG